jgi:hypothetical protein
MAVKRAIDVGLFDELADPRVAARLVALTRPIIDQSHDSHTPHS